MLPPEARLPAARRLIDRGQYFVVHAPRQTGKTTTLAALARQLTTEGKYLAVRFSCEAAEPAGDDYASAERVVLEAIRASASASRVSSDLLPPDPWPTAEPGWQLRAALSAWAAQCPRPLVLFFDEIDALRGPSLLSVLRQLRDGYTEGQGSFVHSVVLCGLRDVRDYKAASGGDPTRLGTASPFNIKVASLRIEDFTSDDVTELYGQHTAETGQEFTKEAVERAFCYTQGQPWLVNALANEIIEEMRVEPPTPITVDHVDEAKERLILARATHLDSLVSKLYEPRVQRVIEPLISGELPEVDQAFNDDVSYVGDLGLIAPGRLLKVANPIYKEVIVRVLGNRTERVIDAEPRSFKLADGRLDFPRLLQEFASFWREHGEILTSTSTYREVAPQLIMMAFLHRIVNGGGYIDREYGVGRGRIDLLVRQPYTAGDGNRAWQREALELKVWRDGRLDPLAEGLQQLDSYQDRLDLATGVLVIFDTRTQAAPITERTAFSAETTPSGRNVTLLRA
jgi:type II secretory pathway predicted ATPase ExeA